MIYAGISRKFNLLYLKWRLIFSILRRCFLFSIYDKTITGLDYIYIWVIRRVFYKKQELLTLREHTSSPPVFAVRISHLFSFQCCVLLFSSCVLYTQCCACHCLWIVHSWLPLRFFSYVYFIFYSIWSGFFKKIQIQIKNQVRNQSGKRLQGLASLCFYELYILFMWFEWTVDGPQCQYNIQEGYYFVIVSEMWEAITIHYIVLVEYSHTCLKGLLYIINPCL